MSFILRIIDVYTPYTTNINSVRTYKTFDRHQTLWAYVLRSVGFKNFISDLFKIMTPTHTVQERRRTKVKRSSIVLVAIFPAHLCSGTRKPLLAKFSDYLSVSKIERSRMKVYKCLAVESHYILLVTN